MLSPATGAGIVDAAAGRPWDGFGLDWSGPLRRNVRERLLHQRVKDIRTHLRRTLPDGVHGGLSWKQASERLAGLASPELYHLLTVELGWTPRQHRDWLVGVVDTEVLGTPRDGTGHFSA